MNNRMGAKPYQLTTIIMALCCAVSASFAGTDAAAFLNAGVGGKALAMGGAVTSIADDSFAIYWNPAGVGRLNRYSLSAMGQSLASSKWDTLTDITPSYQFLGFTFPVNSFSLPLINNQTNTFGVGMMSLGLDGIPLTRVDSAGRIVRDTFKDTEQAYFMSYGFPLVSGRDSLYAGVTFKYITQRFSKVSDASATGYDMDAGMLYDFGTMRFGLVIQRGAVMTWANGRTDTAPLATKFGVSKDVLLKRSVIATGAVDIVQKQGNPLALNAGAEVGVRDLLKSRSLSMDGLFLRTGVDGFVVENRYGYRDAMNKEISYNAGLGLDMTLMSYTVQLDYVFSSRPLGARNTISVCLYF